MTYEVAFQRVVTLKGFTCEVDNDPMFPRQFKILEVGPSFVVVQSTLETYNVSRTRVATHLASGRLKRVSSN